MVLQNRNFRANQKFFGRSILIWVSTAPLLLGQTPTTLTIASSADLSIYGQAVTLTASVNPAPATGRVTFYDGVTVLGTAKLAGGTGALSTILPAAGIRTIEARYAGSTVYAASTAPSFAQTVIAAPATTLHAPVGYPTANTINQHVAVADFNGDGKLDVVTNNNTILMGNGDGSFQPPIVYTSTSNSYSVAAGDFNGDGKPDFATAQIDGNVGVWLNKGDGTFQPPALYSIGAAPHDIVLGDFNNDGVIDVAVASRQGEAIGVGVLLGVGDGTFHPVVTYLAGRRQTALAIADFNGDGNADIVSVDSDDIDQVITVLLGVGDGTFQVAGYEQAAFPQYVATGDFNHDGRPDFAVVNHGGLSVFLGNGDGTFSAQSVPIFTPNTGGALYNGLAIADLDGDGNPDIAYTGSGAPTVGVYLGVGNGTFRGAVNFPAGSGAAGSVIAADFNGDGRTDLAVTTASTLQILLGGTGSFPSVATVSLPPAMGGVPYSATLSATGGTTPYSWSVSVGTPLVNLSSNGTIAGTPAPMTTLSGTNLFTAVVSGPNGTGYYSSQTLSISVAAAFQVFGEGVVGEVGVPYPWSLAATGGTPPYRNWAVTVGSLPPGLSLDPESGAFSGSPTAAGTFPFTVTVNDSSGLTSLPAAVSIFVIAAPTVSTQSLPNAVTGIPYSVALVGINGLAPYRNWTIGGGTLPPGLSLNAALGVISGTPTTVGTFSFSATMQDGAGLTSPPQSLSIVVNQGCVYAISSNGQVFPASGGSGTISITTAPSCSWNVSGQPSWITLTTSASGAGNGTVTLQIAPSSGGDQSATLLVAGQTYLVEQQALTIPGISFIGSMPHLVAEGGWLTTFTFLNKSTAAQTARTNLFSPAGAALQLPIALPQQSALNGDVLASSLDQVIAPNAQFIMQATGPPNVPYSEGSAQLKVTGMVGESVDGFAIFHFNPTNQEAVVPMETRNAASYILPFDNTNGVLTGVAIENISAQNASIPLTIRNDSGTTVSTGTLSLNALGHTSFVLSTPYSSTANIRGTVEFDTPTNGEISVLGIRYTAGTLTTIPVLADVGTSGGLMAHLASGAGWQTTFALVNAGTTAASATLNFYDNNGNPLSLPLTFPQNPNALAVLAPNWTQSIAPSASLWIQSDASAMGALLTGSAQLTTTGNVSGYAIFRYNPNGQEAVVPLESRNAGAYLIAFDNTNGTATGVAINAMSTQPVSVPVVVRDDSGNQITSSTIQLGANGHTSFTLAQQFPQTSGIRGTVEFDTPASAEISVLGIRSPPALTFTTLPPLSK